MSFWSALFGGDAVGKVADLVDDFNYSDQEQAADDLAETKQARAFAAPGQGKQGTIRDVVDAYNSFIRPGITTWLVGGFMGWWQLPQPDAIDPFWLNIFMIVVTFWFGGRVLLKDLPNAVNAIMAFRKR